MQRSFALYLMLLIMIGAFSPSSEKKDSTAEYPDSLDGYANFVAANFSENVDGLFKKPK